MKRPDLSVSAGAYLAAAAGVLLLPLNWLISAAMAAAVHELGHLLALKCCHVDIFGIAVGAFGAKISTGAMSPLQELVCAAAGPLCSLALLLLADAAPVLAMIGLAQGLFNLLPFYPMDGGRVISAAWRLVSEKSSG